MAVPTYVTHVGFGHTTDELAYLHGGSVTGYTLVSGTPNYIEKDDTAGNLAFNTSRAFTPLTNVWISYSLLSYRGQIATSAAIRACRVGGGVSTTVLDLLFVQSTDNDHFVIRFQDAAATPNIIGTGTTEIAVDTDFSVLVWQDGTTFRAKVNGVEDDINVASTPKITRSAIAGRGAAGAGDTERIGPIAIHHSNDSADRPGVVVGDQVVYPNGNDTQGFGDEADCNQGQTGGAYTDVDSWATTVADDTVFVCENAGDQDRFLADLTTVTPVNNFTGIRIVAREAANAGGKSVSNFWVIKDADGTPNLIEISGENISSTTFSTKSMEFPTEPDGGAWSSGALDVLKAGFRTQNTNGANFRASEMMIEICTIDADPPPPSGRPAGDRRILMAGVAA